MERGETNRIKQLLREERGSEISNSILLESGDPSELASRTTLARFIQAGIIPTSTNAVLSETHRTWNRPEAADLAKLYALVAQNYAAVIESYQKAQEVAKQLR